MRVIDTVHEWQEDGKAWKITSAGSNSGMLVQLLAFVDGKWTSRAAVNVLGRGGMQELSARFDVVVADFLLRPEWYKQGCPSAKAVTGIAWRSPEAKAVFAQQVLGDMRLQKGGE
jgi:hypothetical protein